MKTSVKKYCISVFSLLAAIILLLSVTACTVRGQKDDAPADGGDPAFSGNNSDYTESVGYEEGSVEGADLAAAYEQTYRSVVTVSVPEAGGASRSGTGFIVDSDSGLVVTSSSLFMNESGRLAAEECSVGLYDGAVLSADLEGYDAISLYGQNFFADISEAGSSLRVAASANSDIALLRIAGIENGSFSDAGGTSELPSAVGFADSDSLAYGEECFTVAALAHEEDVLPGLLNEGIIIKPFNAHSSSFYYLESAGFGQSTAVAFFDGSFDYLIQTGVPVNSGSEGAPLFDAEGKVVGMVNMRVGDTYIYSGNAPFGIAFATPSETLNGVLTEAGVGIGYEQSEPTRSSCIVNADELLRRQATDPLSRMLMEESPDYLIVDNTAEIVFRKQGETPESGSLASRVAEANLDRTVKIIAYARVGSEEILSEGSGFLIDRGGYIMTNLHVINALAEQNQEKTGLANTSVQLPDAIYCLFERGTTSDGRFIVMRINKEDIIAYHQQGDLAILKLSNPVCYESGETRVSGFEKACTFAEELPRAGAGVVAIGNALGYGVSVSTGVVSIPSFTSYFDIYGYNMIQTDCPINSGNSGGALFDAEGKVVGINTLGFGGSGYDNVSWAIPASFAVEFVNTVNSGVSSGTVQILNPVAGGGISLES